MALEKGVLALRHRLVGEIGDAGVASLAASVASLEGLSPQAARVAADYLVRAGVLVGENAGRPSREDTLHAYLRGAHFALEHVASTVGQRLGATPIPLAVLFEAVAAPGSEEPR